MKNENIICVASASYFDTNKVNVQNIMKRLSKHNKVLYIESVGMRSPKFIKKDIGKVFKRIAGFFKGVKQVDHNLWIVSPIIIPFHKFKIIQKINKFLLAYYIKYQSIKLGFSSSLLWIFIPTGISLIGKLNEKAVIYHCVDEYSNNPNVDKETIIKIEKKLLKKADISFATSKDLFERKKNLTKNMNYIPNVADFKHFHKAYLKGNIPDDIKNIKKPIAGFIGALSPYKLDFELIENCLINYPEISFVFIGGISFSGVNAPVDKLLKYNNFYWLGEKKLAEVPDYLRCFSICLIPFLVNKTTRSCFPMKFFEYFAAGKTIVSTYLPAVWEYSDYFYGSKDNNKFILNIKKALKKPKNSKELIEIASKNTWNIRIKEISDIINKFNLVD